MKIALLIHDLNNLGGIITYVERLAKGIKELGHECDILKLVYNDKATESRTRNPQYQPGETDLLVHPIFGWSFPKKNRVPYKGEAIKSAIEKLSSYDILIWETPSPSMPINKEKRYNLDWFNLFQNSARQIITIHDGNLLTLYPHLAGALYFFSDKSKISVTAPHPRGFNSAVHLGLPQTLVMIPQYPAYETITFPSKKKGFATCQIFKAWKHVDEPVTAISYMKPVEESSCKERIMSGIGLHYYYMTSPDKCKYFHPKESREDLVGRRIWDTALENGMEYRGVLGFQERDQMLKDTLLFLDPSWVNDQLGNHLNGAVPESIRLGCVPVGKPRTFRFDESDMESLYQPNRNYLEIPQNASPAEYAEALESFSNIGLGQWEEIVGNNYLLLHEWFDYRMVAQQLIDQATKGVANSGAMKYLEGQMSPSQELKNASNKMISTFQPTQYEVSDSLTPTH